MKKKLFSILVILLVIFMFAGCQAKKGNDESNNEPKINLTYFGYKADTTNLLAIEDSIHSFQKKHKNVNIVYEGIKGTAYYDMLETRAALGKLDDIFMLDHDSSIKLIEQGLLEDLSDIIDPNSFVSAAASQFVNADNTIYFVPTAVITFGLYCNLNLLKAHGFDKAPTNFVEFKTMCNYFVTQGITPIVANNNTTVRTLVLAKGMYDVYQQDDYSDTIKKINSGEIDIVELLKPGVEMVHQMFADKWMDGEEAVNVKATSDDLVKFKAGDRPFMFTGSWASPRVSGEGGVNFEYEIQPYPLLETGSILVVDIATCMSVNAKGANKEIAKEFVSHMTEKDVIWDYCDSQSSFTPIKGDSRLPNDKALQPQIAYLNKGQTVISSNFNITLPLNEALRAVGLSIMQGKTVDEALVVLREGLAKN